jgi:GntR family transcriptional regulator
MPRDGDGAEPRGPGVRRLENRSLTSRARDALLESILGGDFPDDRLPPEGELALQLGVSRSTLRGALRTLEDHGLITRRRGIGTTINGHALRSSVSLRRVVGFHDLIQESGYRSEIAWTKFSDGEVTPELAERISASVGEELLLVDRLFLADGTPAIHVLEHIPRAQINRSFRRDEFPESIFDFASNYCRSSIDHTVLEIGATTASGGLVTMMAVFEGAALLEVEEIHYCLGEPTLYSKIYAVPPVIRFSVVRTRS